MAVECRVLWSRHSGKVKCVNSLGQYEDTFDTASSMRRHETVDSIVDILCSTSGALAAQGHCCSS